MYFSLITPAPNAEREAAIQWSKGPYEQHQWLWQFLAAERGSKRDFLFRHRDGDNELPGFYVVSSRKPVAINDAWQVNSKEYDPQLSIGQRLAFDLRANPVVTHKVNEKTRRDDVVMHKKKQLLSERGLQRWSDWRDDDPEKPLLYELVHSTCLNWLEQRAKPAGFALVNEDETRKGIRADGYGQQRVDKKDIRFSTVDFSGVLEVIDPTLFKQALFKGIGHAKAFGCGLLLVKSA